MKSGSDHAIVCTWAIGGALIKSSAASAAAPAERDASWTSRPVMTMFAANKAAPSHPAAATGAMPDNPAPASRTGYKDGEGGKGGNFPGPNQKPGPPPPTKFHPR